jgi:hypothetical protein
MSKPKGTWRFSAVWIFPGHMVAATSTDPIVLQNELRQMVLQAERLPLYFRNIELKYKHSDCELAQTEIPILLPVRGYIQPQNNCSIDSDNLKLWFNANWSPVQNQLRRGATYLAWVQDDPAYRHVQVDVTPAVARAGRHKKDGQVLHAALPYLWHFSEFASGVPCLAQGRAYLPCKLRVALRLCSGEAI